MSEYKQIPSSPMRSSTLSSGKKFQHPEGRPYLIPPTYHEMKAMFTDQTMDICDASLYNSIVFEQIKNLGSFDWKFSHKDADNWEKFTRGNRREMRQLSMLSDGCLFEGEWCKLTN